jgi:hypothetical protein
MYAADAAAPVVSDVSVISDARSPGAGREIAVLGCTYFVAFIFASMSIGFCGDGCCFAFYSILGITSAFLMLRRSFPTRVVCLLVLLASVVGMWHEKETRDTYTVAALRQQIQTLQQAHPEETP